MVDILLCQADELLVAAEDGGYAQGLVGHVVASMFCNLLRGEKYKKFISGVTFFTRWRN